MLARIISLGIYRDVGKLTPFASVRLGLAKVMDLSNLP